MIFVINKLKYDTDKMELISDKCRYTCTKYFYNIKMSIDALDIRLWRSVNGRWLLTYRDRYFTHYAEALSTPDAANLLLKYDLDKYEKIFGNLEEA